MTEKKYIKNTTKALAIGLSAAMLLANPANTFASSNKLNKEIINVKDQKQEQSMAPVVEVSKDKITLATSMKGSIKIYLYTKPHNYDIGLNRP